jgi:hypothetical protein
MTPVPDSVMWSWLPGSLPRVVLIVRLSQKTRPDDRHDRHLPLPAATRFLHQLQLPRCGTFTETSGIPLVLSASPIQAP